MSNATPKAPMPKKYLFISIAALVFALLGLCAGWMFAWAGLACPLLAVLLAVLSLKSPRKALPIVALVVAVMSFCLLLAFGLFVWTDPGWQKINTGWTNIGQLLMETFRLLGELIRVYLKKWFNI
jgi:hypothetical protein